MSKSNKVKEMFKSIAGRYDRGNTVLSLGIHHIWRKRLVQMSSRLHKAKKILDCATGTGDLAIEWKRNSPQSTEVLGTDFCKEMLDKAPQKAQKESLDVDFEVCDLTDMPYESNSFDIVSVAFGIRNVENVNKGIKELTRVLKPGGEFFVLEFGQPKSKIINHAYSTYSKKILPKVGSMVTGNKEAYQYLEDSSAKFPCRESFLALLRENARFSELSYTSLSLGIAYIYRAVKEEIKASS